MIRKNPNVDVINDVLKLTLEAYPESNFIKSLLFQYQERGGLSKKQLEGLYDKASKIATIGTAKLATLEAIILKKVTRERSPQSIIVTELNTKDTESGAVIEAILQKYPQHKRVLFYKAKFDNNEELSSSEKTELERFKKLLL